MSRIIKCSICGKNKQHKAKGMCKKCYMEIYMKKYKRENLDKWIGYDRKYRENNREEIRKQQQRHREKQPTYGSSKTNKECPQYLGIYITERVLKHIFNNVEVMKPNNIGFDFICNKGKKIDVKSACRSKHHDQYSNNWLFHINNNKIADYFLCIAFDDRENTNPEHLWLIPGEIINNKTGIGISESRLDKWSKYELDRKLDDVIICCDTIKNN